MTDTNKELMKDLQGNIECALEQYCLNGIVDDDGEHLPLVDVLTPPQDTIEFGKLEMNLLVEQILEYIEPTINRALSPNAVVIPREIAKKVQALPEKLFNKDGPWIKLDQVLAILSQYGERKS
jgi:hypothetical protein